MATAEWRKIKLADLAGEVERELIDEAEPLRPERIPSAIIAELLPSGLTLVDGYHRTAGVLRWVQDTDRDPKDVEVRVVVVHCQNVDDDDVAAAADPGHPDHEAAIARLIEAAGE